ncbi:hypothetical protein HPP92_029028 [Vanilla planifolia]|uniref:Uncharacterized protein n=1 Tax=Vanilla planifolia TaxID=51239 RepID=A0A835U1K6_VANPL|nr:hypothetical protein HPP92_029028 [Vanilla planifolia]KAG0446067.1 hypothetical protein HPP92_029016 [Vanilla planifolia]
MPTDGLVMVLLLAFNDQRRENKLNNTTQADGLPYQDGMTISMRIIGGFLPADGGQIPLMEVCEPKRRWRSVSSAREEWGHGQLTTG